MYYDMNNLCRVSLNRIMENRVKINSSKHCLPQIVGMLLMLIIVGCHKDIYFHAYQGTTRSEDNLALIKAGYYSIEIEAVDNRKAASEPRWHKAHYWILPKHQKISYYLSETIPASTIRDPITDREKVITPEKHFSKRGDIWLTAEAGVSYSLMAAGTGPHWHVWIEETESKAIASGIKQLGFYKPHSIRRACGSGRCSDWLIEDDRRSGVQECKIIERDTGKVLRRCKGKECIGTGMCY